MFKHLLVPLDGSHLAETALPAAAFFAQALNASVTLVHIIERNAPKEVHSDHHITEADEALVYLGEVAGRSFAKTTAVQTHVHTTQESDVARSIVEHSQEMAPDLVILCTHGRSGMRDLLFGNIAQQVIAFGKTPVLLIRPGLMASTEQFACHKVLLPLDGDPEHEQGIALAAALCQAIGAELHLLMVVPTYGTLTGQEATTSRLMPGATSVMLEMAELGAEDYLKGILAGLQSTGLVLTAEVMRGEPVNVIEETAEAVKADLIVLGTHGKAGTEAFWSGSVAPKVSGRSRVPLLLVPVVI